MVSEGLDELITACDEVINDSQGRLDQGEQDFSAANPDKLNVQGTIQKMCKSAHPHNKKGETKCVNNATSKIQSM